MRTNLNRDAVRALARAFTPDLQPATVAGQRLSAEAQWGVLVTAVAWGEMHLLWPKEIPALTLLPPLGSGHQLEAPLRLPTGLLMVTARRALAHAETTGTIPSIIPLVGATHHDRTTGKATGAASPTLPFSHSPIPGEWIGPMTLAAACARAIPKHFRARWPATVTFHPTIEPW